MLQLARNLFQLTGPALQIKKSILYMAFEEVCRTKRLVDRAREAQTWCMTEALKVSAFVAGLRQLFREGHVPVPLLQQLGIDQKGAQEIAEMLRETLEPVDSPIKSRSRGSSSEEGLGDEPLPPQDHFPENAKDEEKGDGGVEPFGKRPCKVVKKRPTAAWARGKAKKRSFRLELKHAGGAETDQAQKEELEGEEQRKPEAEAEGKRDGGSQHDEHDHDKDVNGEPEREGLEEEVANEPELEKLGGDDCGEVEYGEAKEEELKDEEMGDYSVDDDDNDAGEETDMDGDTDRIGLSNGHVDGVYRIDPSGQRPIGDMGEGLARGSLGGSGVRLDVLDVAACLFGGGCCNTLVKRRPLLAASPQDPPSSAQQLVQWDPAGKTAFMLTPQGKAVATRLDMALPDTLIGEFDGVWHEVPGVLASDVLRKARAASRRKIEADKEGANPLGSKSQKMVKGKKRGKKAGHKGNKKGDQKGKKGVVVQGGRKASDKACMDSGKRADQNCNLAQVKQQHALPLVREGPGGERVSVKATAERGHLILRLTCLPLSIFLRVKRFLGGNCRPIVKLGP